VGSTDSAFGFLQTTNYETCLCGNSIGQILSMVKQPVSRCAHRTLGAVLTPPLRRLFQYLRGDYNLKGGDTECNPPDCSFEERERNDCDYDGVDEANTVTECWITKQGGHISNKSEARYMPLDSSQRPRQVSY